MAKETDYSTYSLPKREQILQLIYEDLGVSPLTGWVKFLNRGGKLSLSFADDLGFWLASQRNLTPVEAGAEDTGSSFRAWATLAAPDGARATGEASAVKTNKRVSALREEMEVGDLDEIEDALLSEDWISIELQRGLSMALEGTTDEGLGALIAALARILDGAQKKGEARDLVLELLPGALDLGRKLDLVRTREEVRYLAGLYAGHMMERLQGENREQARRSLLLVAVKTMEDLGVRAKALDRAKARAAIDLCQGRIVKGNKRVAMKPTEVVLPPVAMSLPAAAARLVSEPPAVQLPPAAPVTIAAPPAASARPEAPAVKLEPVMTKPKAAKPEAKPEAKPKASSGATRLATFKQQAYVRDLMRKAGVKEENIAKRMEKLLGVVKSIEELSAQEATTAIDKLRGILAKKKPVA